MTPQRRRPRHVRRTLAGDILGALIILVATTSMLLMMLLAIAEGAT